MTSIFEPMFLLSPPSGAQWIILLILALLLFGGKKIPELARGLGKGIREFNDAKDGLKKEMEKGTNSESDNTPSDTTK